MKYIIRAEIDPVTGLEVESQPQKIQEFIGKWQTLNPIAMYFSLTARELTIIVEAPNEDAFFTQLHATWVFTKSYPTVRPVATVEEFPQLMQRLGMV